LSLVQRKEPSRPITSGSDSSALSDADWRKVQRLLKSIVGEVLGLDVRKLANTLKKHTIDNLILKAENEGLHHAVFIEKGRRKHSKPLFDTLREGSNTKAIFFSPTKIQHAQEQQDLKLQEKH